MITLVKVNKSEKEPRFTQGTFSSFRISLYGYYILRNMFVKG